jgi:diguanylate cyclase (GGDEF)-like protein
MPQKPPQISKVLLIDDAEPIHDLLRYHLADEPLEVLSALDAASGLRMARELAPDIILLDVEMPDADGFETIRRLKADTTTIDIPVVFVTGVSSTDDKIRGLDLGASDYVTKPFEPAELRARVRATLRTRRLLELLARKAMIDGLTGLWNRGYFEQHLDTEVARARRAGKAVACIMADLDHFKSINDRYGHPAGDAVIAQVAQILVDGCREQDIVCRYGGEEFAVILPMTGEAEAQAIAERLRLAIASHQGRYNGLRIDVTCSFGVADIHQIPPSLVELADQALYAAKQSGRNKVSGISEQPRAAA